MTRKMFHVSTPVVGMLMLFFSVPLTAQDNSSKPTVNHAVASGISAPLRDLAKLPPHRNMDFTRPTRSIAFQCVPLLPWSIAWNRTRAGGSANYSIGINVLGLGNGFPDYTIGFAPPDTNMAVGDTQIVEWVNISWAVFDKSGNALTGAHRWQLPFGRRASPERCALNYDSGDPIAQWDRVAHRWLLFQNVFTSPYAVCVAVSTSSDATGTYMFISSRSPATASPTTPRSAFGPPATSRPTTISDSNDGSFLGSQVCAYNSAKLLVGDATAEQQCVQLTDNDYSLLPGDVDSPTPPPAGQDEFFIGSVGRRGQFSSVRVLLPR